MARTTYATINCGGNRTPKIAAAIAIWYKNPELTQPWPLQIAREILDLTNHNLLRMPLPELGLIANLPLVRACRHALLTLELLTKPDTEWTDKEDDAYIAIQNEIAGYET